MQSNIILPEEYFLFDILEAYSKHSRISKMELLAKIVNSWKSLANFAKSFILDIRLGSEFASGFGYWANIRF